MKPNIPFRAVLSRLPLPMLALAASYGVYSFASLYVPWPVALVQAAAFELTYLGLAVIRDLQPADRRRATAISIGAVVVSIVYNSAAGLFHRNPAWLTGLPWYAELAGSVLHGAPLAWVAYLVADLLLHTSRTVAVNPRMRQLRATVRRLAHRVREARAVAAQFQAQLAQVREEVAHVSHDRAQVDAQASQTAQIAAQLNQDNAQLRAQLAQTQQELAQARAAQMLDPFAVAQELIAHGASVRKAADFIGWQESTLRNRRKARTNGHLQEVEV